MEGDDLIADVGDSITLSAEVLDTSWVTITMDGARTRQLVLVPGSQHQWRATEKFVLSLSNAGGVRFIRDGTKASAVWATWAISPRDHDNAY